jgi:DNA-binding MarR family transcriptional regulator
MPVAGAGNVTIMRPELSTDAAYEHAIASVEEQFGTLIRMVRANWKDAAAAVHPDLQPVGYKILGSLVHSGRMPASRLVETLSVDKSVLSRQVKLMEQLGFISVAVDPDDGRARLLEATPLGVERITAVHTTNQARLRERLRQWSPDDLERFAELLGRLAAPPD